MSRKTYSIKSLSKIFGISEKKIRKLVCALIAHGYAKPCTISQQYCVNCPFKFTCKTKSENVLRVVILSDRGLKMLEKLIEAEKSENIN